MFGQHGLEFGMSARVLVLILHAGRPIGVALGKRGHAIFPERSGDHIGLSAKDLALVGLGAVTAAADAERQRAAMMTNAEVQRRETAHRDPDDVRLSRADVMEHCEDMV